MLKGPLSLLMQSLQEMYFLMIHYKLYETQQKLE